MDQVSQEHDDLQRDLMEEDIIANRHLFSRIDTWEEKSIEKIRRVAEDVRVNLRERLTGTKTRLRTSLQQITKELQIIRQTDDYTEIEFKK